MRVLIVSEGKHELGGALKTLVVRLSGKAMECNVMKISDPALRVHHGKGPGFFKKAVRCMLHAQSNGYEAVIVVVDEDGERDRRRQFNDAQEHQLATIPRALGIAIRTFDAWMLADEQALAKALGAPVQRQPAPEQIRDPKQVCIDLWMAHDLGEGLTEMYAVVAQHAHIETIEDRCPD